MSKFLEYFDWVRTAYNAEPRDSGDCLCGRSLTTDEYQYHGGSHGLYVCDACGSRWVVDVNGVIWNETPEWLSKAGEPRD